MNSRTRIKWVLFDLDGTLADSTEILYGVYQKFLAARGSTGTREEFSTLQGSVAEIVAFLRDAHRLSGVLAVDEQDYHRLLVESYAKVAPYTGAEALLRELKQQGCTLLLVTSAHRECVALFLRMHHWEQYFAAVVCGTDVPKGKPAPNIYHWACHANGIDRERALVLEDSLSGFQSAINAGLYCIRVDHLTTKLGDVLGLLEGTMRKDFHQACTVLARGALHLVQARDGMMLTPEQLQRVEAIWREETARNPKLFNGTLLAYRRHQQDMGTTRVTGTFVEYKWFLAQLREPILDLGIAPIGVSGMAILNDGATRYVLLAIRSDIVTQYPGYLELVPSGTLDQSALGPDGTIQYEDKLREEFFEETKLPAQSIASVRSSCLVLDRKGQVYDACCIIELNMTRAQVLNAFHAVSEYRKPCFVPVKDLPRFVEQNAHALVPTSLALLHAFLEEERAEI